MQPKITKINNKVEHVWSLIAENSVIDGSSNNLSLINVLEQLNINLSVEDTEKQMKAVEVVSSTEKKLAVPLSMRVVSLWKRSDISKNESISLDARVSLVSPKGNELLSSDYIIDFKPNIKRFRGTVQINGLQIDGFGEYKFVISYKEPGLNSDYIEAGQAYLEVTSLK